MLTTNAENEAFALSQAVNLYPLDNAKALQAEAMTNGFTQARLDAIANQELANHESFSSKAQNATQASFGGLFFLAVLLMAMQALPRQNMTAHVLITLVFIVVMAGSLALRFWGQKEKRRAATATAVLRICAKGLSHDQIATMKEHPDLRGSEDTQRMLTSVQDQLAKQVAMTS